MPCSSHLGSCVPTAAGTHSFVWFLPVPASHLLFLVGTAPPATSGDPSVSSGSCHVSWQVQGRAKMFCGRVVVQQAPPSLKMLVNWLEETVWSPFECQPMRVTQQSCCLYCDSVSISLVRTAGRGETQLTGLAGKRRYTFGHAEEC